LFESRRHSWLVQRGVVVFLGLGWRDVADRLQQPAIVEPIDPFQGRELDGFERPPRPAPMDDLGLVETVDGLGQSIDAPMLVKGPLGKAAGACRWIRRPHGRRSASGSA
jgi:hypothetical protein